MTQKKSKKIVLMALMVALVSLMIGPVSAIDYDFWHSHMSQAADRVLISGVHPWGTTDVYSDGLLNLPSIYDQAVAQNMTSGGGTYDTFKLTMAGTSTGYNFNKNTPIIISGSTVSDTTGGHSFSLGDGDIFQIRVVNGSLGYQLVGPQYVYHASPTPIISDFIYSPEEPWIAPAIINFSYVESGKKANTWWWEVVGPNYYSYSMGSPTFNTTFPIPGSYLVGLTVTNGTESDSKSQTFNVLNEAGSYSLIMSPDTGTIATNFTAIVTAGVETLGATLNQFTMHCSVDGVVSYCTTDGKDPIFVKQEDGNWYLDGDLYSASFPSSVPLKFNVPGIHTVVGWFFTTDPTDIGKEVSDTVTVTATPGQIKLSVEVRDAGTNALIGGSDILLKKEDGTWDNQTVGSGFRDYYVPGGNNIGVGATAAGYTDSVIEYNRFYEDAKKVVLLSRVTGPVPEGNNTLSVYVRKGGTADVIGLDGATVKLNDGQTKLTPASGLAQFLVLDAETYFITVSKPGYLTVSKYFAVNGAVNSVTIDMLVPGVTVTPTLAPGETPAPGTTTPAPGTTYPPGVPMPGTVTTYPPGVPVIGGDGGSVAANATARDAAVKNLETWMLWGGTFLFAIFAIMFIGFSGDALKKWSWLWK